MISATETSYQRVETTVSGSSCPIGTCVHQAYCCWEVKRQRSPASWSAPFCNNRCILQRTCIEGVSSGIDITESIGLSTRTTGTISVDPSSEGVSCSASTSSRYRFLMELPPVGVVGLAKVWSSSSKASLM